jgi:hypothetical protein
MTEHCANAYMVSSELMRRLQIYNETFDRQREQCSPFYADFVVAWLMKRNVLQVRWAAGGEPFVEEPPGYE